MIKTSAFKGELRDMVRITDLRGWKLFEYCRDCLPGVLERRGVPCTCREDEVQTGGFFGGSTNPILIVSYPNPPSRFFDIVFVFNDNIISFQTMGESEQNFKANKKAWYENEGKSIRAAMVSVDEFILQQEKAWQADVLDALASLFNPE